MKAIVILLLLSISLALAYPFEDASEDISPNGWFVPQLDGSLKWVTKEEAKSAERKLSMRGWLSKLKVTFYLFTQEDPDMPQELFIGDSTSLSESNFNSQNPTRIIIHGWQNDYNSDVNVEIRNAFLDTMECNVICVDWSGKSKSYNYMQSKNNVPKVGEKVAELIDFLADEGDMSFDDLHVIGHSLGAHVAGFAGKHVTSGQIHTIIGLDPAWPLYTFAGDSNRLSATDALYVESIHTNGGLLGFLRPISQVDFYVSGGVTQPGCGLDVGGICSHSRAYSYYAQSIRENVFTSRGCYHWSLAVSNVCLGGISPDIKLGSPNNYKNARGYYYTPVGSKAPYGIN